MLRPFIFAPLGYYIIYKKSDNEFPEAQQVSLKFGTPLSRDKPLENQMNTTRLSFPKTGGFQQV